MSAWAADFAASSFGFPWGVQEKVAGQRHASVVDPVGRYLGKVGRIDVLPGDNNVAGSGAGERCEALIDATLTDGMEGAIDWWAWAVMFDPSFVTDDSDWNAVSQWHNSGSSGGTCSFRAHSSSWSVGTFGGSVAAPDVHAWPLGERVNGRWYEVVTQVKWSADKTVGRFGVELDGRVVVPLTACATLYAGETVYFKQGYYRHAEPQAARLYYAGTNRNTTRAAVIAQAFPGSTRWDAPTPPPTPPAADVPAALVALTAAATAIGTARKALAAG